jgi:omega-6 fatty acid desaturase (delta-12 desaturase)
MLVKIEPRFRASTMRSATVQLVNTLGPLLAVFTLMFLAQPSVYWLTLLMAPIASGFLIRSFIIMHDCTHGSFTPSRRANEIIGFATGLLTLMPFAQWRRDHALHHASSGDLDRRGSGDIDTLTVQEYLALGRWGQLRYRAFRNPFVLFGLGPLYYLAMQRFQSPGVAGGGRRATSVHATNIALVLLFAPLMYFLGVGAVIAVYLPAYWIAVSVGIFLFYVQHQFEGTYWESHHTWDYGTAALQGSSHYRLPRVLEWITGSIGLHHVHHIDPKIPNYLLRRCHESYDEFRAVPEMTFRASLRTVSLKLWDPEQRRLVGFDAVRQYRARGASTTS